MHPPVVYPMANTVALVVLQLLLTSLTLSTAVTVSIDAVNGTNTSDCVTGKHSCRTLQYAVNHSYNDTTFLLLSDLTLLSTVNFTSRHNITITGADGQPKQLICSCNYSQQIPCGLLFENIANLKLKNVAVKHCGIPMNVTIEREDITIRGGVIIKTGTGTTSLVRYNASENNGYGTVILNTGGTVFIYNSTFSFNTIITSEIPTEIGGGGLAIIVSCSYTESTCLPSGNTYNISKSRFHNNIIEWEKNSSFSFWKLAYGGGLNVAFDVNTAGNKLLISNSTFNNNSALYGGGVFIGINSTKSFVVIQNSIFNNNTAMKGSGLHIACENTCHNNKINISSSQLKNNRVFKGISSDQGGSGLAIYVSGSIDSFLASGNNITLHNCVFSYNNAWFGGGTHVFCGRQFGNKVDNLVHFINCSWTKNFAPISPAVDVSAGYSFINQTQYTVNVTFTDCIFSGNMVNQHFSSLPLSFHMKQYTGTFLVNQVPVYFSGNAIFTNNDGTALFASSSVITFLEGSNTLFLNNTGVFGGAITLMGFSLLQYQENTTFHFMENTATLGGAINVRSFDQHVTFSSYNCFLYFWGLYDRPKNVLFNFINNTATTGIGNAIFMSSVKPCVRSCAVILNDPNLNEHNLFVDNTCFGKFDFRPHGKETTATEAFTVYFQYNVTMLSFIPGMAYQLPLDVMDDFGNNINNVTVYAAQLADCSSHDVSIDPAFTNVASNTIRILGTPNETCDLVLTIRGPQMIQFNIQFNLTWCRPGYALDYIYPTGKSCICSASLPQYHYNGIDYCNSTTSAAIINPGLWVGYDTDNNKEPTQENLYTAPCPAAYCNSTLVELSMSAELLKNYMCEKNRQGFLCGECFNETTVFSTVSIQHVSKITTVLLVLCFTLSMKYYLSV